MANTPQITTRAVAGMIGAPPKRADTTPSKTKPTTVNEANDHTNVSAGNSRIPITGTIAPTMNDSAEAKEA